MEHFKIEGTLKTPAIEFNALDGTIKIEGRSIPENSKGFYEPVLEWLNSYAANPKPSTVADIKLEYFNTSSSKCILDIFKILDSIHETGNEVMINWYYEKPDEDMLEAGEEYQTIVSVPFTMKVIE